MRRNERKTVEWVKNASFSSIREIGNGKKVEQREKRKRCNEGKEGEWKSSRNEKEKMEKNRRTSWVGPERWRTVDRGRGESRYGERENLPTSSVRSFLHPSCPSFGCFHGRHLVGSFTPGRRAARKWERGKDRKRVIPRRVGRRTKHAEEEEEG